MQEVVSSIPRVVCTSVSSGQRTAESFKWCTDWRHYVIHWQQCV